jgi:hypothetical protein
MIFFCYVFVSVGVVFCFKALDTWCLWLEDQSEDTDDERERRNIYPLTFYVQAGTVTMIAIFLLVWAMTRDQPNAQEELLIIFGLMVAAGSLILGQLSSYLA